MSAARVVSLLALFTSACGAAPGPPIAPGPPAPTSGDRGGELGGCRLELGSTTYWRSWAQGIEDETAPDGFGALQTAIELTVDCVAPARFSVESWVLQPGAAPTPIRFLRAIPAGEHVDPWDASFPAGTTTLMIVSDDGPFAPQEGEVRALMRWTAADGTSMVLGAASGTVQFVS